MSSTQPARGTRDFLPAELRRREHVIATIRDVYERYGFEPVETPAVENIDTLLGKYGDEGNKLIFKILRRGEHEASGTADLALRYDLTVPLARVVAQYQSELPKFFKRYQIQPVWRADRPARGRYREFYQCDIDAVGSTSVTVEVELVAAVSDALTRLGFADFHVRLNDRRLLSAALHASGIPPVQETDALVALDKLDRIGVTGVTEEFRARGIDAAAADRALTLFAGGGPDETSAATLARLERHLGGNEALGTVTRILALSDATPAAGRVRLDPTLARGLSYYTGAIMEIAVPDLAGSLGGGGRYDNLVGMFLGRPVPACGFALGLERIVLIMTERGMFPATVAVPAADVMIAAWNDLARADELALASELRAADLRVDVYPDADKPGKQFKYAAARGYPFVAIIGDDERAAQTVTVKDLRSGQQVTLPRQAAAAHVRQALTPQEKDAE